MLSKDIQVLFQVSNPQEDKVPKVRCLPQDDSVFSECALLKKCPDLEIKGKEYEICMPWLDGRAYLLAVWFITLRNMLKKPGIHPWSNQFELRDHFLHKQLFIGEFPYSESVPCFSQSAIFLSSPTRSACGRRPHQGLPHMEDFDFCYKTMRLSDSI